MGERRDPDEARAVRCHRQIADRIRQDPAVVGAAIERLERRLAEEPADPVLLEWLDLLRLLDPGEIADYIESDAPRARRLRSSSPLVWLVR